jgi:TolA-binding protein
MQLGNYYQQSRSGEKALRTFRELVRLYPQSEWAEEAQYRTALFFKTEKKWTEAIEEMEKLIRQYPKSHLLVDGYIETGDIYLVIKNYPKALERYDWVIKNHPQHSQMKKVYLGMEVGYRNLGKMEEAEKILRELITKYPNDDIRFEGHLRLGLLYFMLKRFGEAISTLSIATQSPEESVAGQAQFRLGEAYWGNGNKEQAILQFSRVVYLYPHRSELMEEALLNLGTLYMEEKKFSEAGQVYRKLLEKTRKDERRAVAKKMLDQINQGVVR